MPTAILAGIPARYIPTLKGLLDRETEHFSNWIFKFSPTQEKLPRLRIQDLAQISRIAEPHDEIHVLGFSSTSDRNLVSGAIRSFFRFRWFNNELLREIGSPESTFFVEELIEVLAEEEAWAERIMPKTLKSPLLLPETSFQCSKKSFEMWRYASAYGSMENITSAETSLGAFEKLHLRRIVFDGFSQHKWIDDSDRIFSDTGKRHAVPPAPRMWKYSYRIEDGFHFDVTHLHKRKFSLRDFSTKSFPVPAEGHINIDPHGHTRDGH